MTQQTSTARDAENIKAESWWRTQSATMALLKHAYHVIDDVEQRLAEQEKRIRMLENIAASDPMTGLLNRRGFEDFFQRDLSHLHRQNSDGSLLVLIDLDQFKPINDTYGHQAGDACLKMVADVLMKSVRKTDAVARFGGDEFALLLTHTNAEKACKKLAQLKKSLNKLFLDWEGKKLHFGASMGEVFVTGADSYDDCYRQADKSLYADKQNRRMA